MTSELKNIINEINKAFIEHFKQDPEMETIFIIGPMANNNYIDKLNNNYDIGVICKYVSPYKVKNFENFLKKISQKLTTNIIKVEYSCLYGLVNKKIDTSKKHLLIHAIIYTPEYINSLPETYKYQIGNNYKIIYGKDLLEEYKDIKYNLDDLVNGYEGINYFIDMLKKNQFRYKKWDIKENKCEVCYHYRSISDDNLIINNCFYAVNTFIDNLINYCEFNNYDIPKDKMIFTIKILKQINLNENYIFLLQGLFSKSESILKAIFANPLKETINLLEIFKLYIYHLDSIFIKNEDKRTKTLNKYKYNYLLRI